MKKKIKETPVLLFIYKRTKKTWRGVAHPFDLVCEGTSLESVKQEIEERTKSYLQLCKDNKFPDKWMNVQLTDKKDQKIFNEIKEEIIKSVENFGAQQKIKEQRVYELSSINMNNLKFGNCNNFAIA
jgi:hypothetical protein